MQFHFHANQSHFHKNAFALRLALKQRHQETRKWPILVTEGLIIHVSAESRHKHGALIRISALKGNRIISY